MVYDTSRRNRLTLGDTRKRSQEKPSAHTVNSTIILKGTILLLAIHQDIYKVMVVHFLMDLPQAVLNQWHQTHHNYNTIYSKP